MRGVPILMVVLGCTDADPIAPPNDASVLDSAPDARKIPVLIDAGPPPVTGPRSLSESGLYSDFASRTLAPGVIAYSPRYELWADGATKTRYFYLPPHTIIDTSNIDNWIFPVGTKAWKEFRMGDQLVETRWLWKATEDAWWEAAYLWNQDGTDAIVAPNGSINANGTTHDVPSQTDCNVCHMNVSDVLIGISAIQLSQNGQGLLIQLANQNKLSHPPPSEFEIPGSGNVKDALGYMHANCGHCHNDGSKLNEQSALRLRVKTTDTTPEDTGAYKTSFHLLMRHVIPPDIDQAVIPGDPADSGLLVRMQRRDSWAMPPLATKIVDDAGANTVSTWIRGLP